MSHVTKYNSENYLDMTAYLAMRNIDKQERMERMQKQKKLGENGEFRRGDIYLADLQSGAVGINGSHVQGGRRPVVVLQNNVGNFFAPTLVVVPITSKVWKKPSQPTHYLIKRTGGMNCDGVALGEQITTIDKRQCLKYLGKVSRLQTEAIREAAECAIGGDVDIPENIDSP